MAKKIDAKEVELYLLKNTDFFLTRESLVSELSFKHDSDGATSLLEMQIRKLRDEQSRLNDMLSGFLSTGKENEEVFLLIERAINWLKKNNHTVIIKKWKTKLWGEIPADFGRK